MKLSAFAANSTGPTNIRQLGLSALLSTLCAVAIAQSPVAPSAPSGASRSPIVDNPLIPATPRLDTRLSTPSRTGGVVQLDRIVAVVNNEVITAAELAEQMNIVSRNLQKQGTPLPPQDALQKQLLERMINDLIQVQEAKETGIRVDDNTLDKTLQRIADENSVSMTEFRRLLEQDGITWAKFREDIRNQVVMSRLREREIEGSISVTEAEVDTQLALEAREATTNQEFRLAHILVLVPEQATSQQVETRRRRAMQALSELRKGAEFAQVSAQFSDAPDALQGGSLGWREANRLPSIFVEAINTLKPGEVSDILKSPNGFHIVKLLDRRGKNAVPTVQQTRARHILLKNNPALTEEEARTRLTRLRERIIGGADFAELAKVHSDDPSNAKGGDLGWISPGDTVPEFERVMNQLRDNELSQPFQSPFGWHIVQVMERRSEGLSEERRRAVARNAIRLRKADEAYTDWLRQTRDRAFVELRLEDKG
ncbi:MAG: peptidylprolyl isomerase [Burkholderiales bacterium]|jgi:peptidyl-prolyl cis-trans isomerase SurA|nr:peptidylprolyl isomerase [Nitrosomonadaceae bacterium]